MGLFTVVNPRKGLTHNVHLGKYTGTIQSKKQSPRARYIQLAQMTHQLPSNIFNKKKNKFFSKHI